MPEKYTEGQLLAIKRDRLKEIVQEWATFKNCSYSDVVPTAAATKDFLVESILELQEKIVGQVENAGQM